MSSQRRKGYPYLNANQAGFSGSRPCAGSSGRWVAGPVEQLAAAGLHPSLHDRVHSRHLDPAEYSFDARVSEDSAEFAKRHGLTFADPTRHLSGGRSAGRTVVPMTREQIRAVQQAAVSPAHRLAVS